MTQRINDNPQQNCQWPGGSDALKRFRVNGYNTDRLRKLLDELSPMPYLAQWDIDLMNGTSAELIIDSPEFIALLRLKMNSLSEQEKMAIVLNAQEVDKIPEKEFTEHGDCGMHGLYYKAKKLVAYWGTIKTHQAERKLNKLEKKDEHSKNRHRLMACQGYELWTDQLPGRTEVLEVIQPPNSVRKTLAINHKLPNGVNKAIEEAKAWVKQHPVKPKQDNDELSSTKKVAATFGKYNFNGYGVCINPDIAFSFQTKKIYCQLKVCETKNGFAYGYHYGIKGTGTGTGSSGGLPSYSSKVYEHRSMALLQVAQNAKKYFSKYKKITSKEWKPLEDFILSIQNGTLPTTKQSPSSINKTHMLQSELQVVKLSAISTSDTNQLLREPWELEEPALKELTGSIKEKGVIQPVVLRPNGKAGKYFLVCGERRFHASQLAGLKDIPALIKTMSEEEAFDLQITENLQRKDVHPMKEAQAYKALMDAHPETNTVQELAHRFGKGADYIAQRLSFNNLIPEMRKEFAGGKMLIGHAILFARLQEADQKECFVHCKPKYGPAVDQYEPIKAVEAYIMQKLVREIKKACFNPNDPTLLASAGPCNTCPKRTGTNELFADIKEKDRCFDGTCFSDKTSAHIIACIASLKENNENLALVGEYGSAPSHTVKKYITKNGLRLLKEYSDYQSAVKTDKGAIKALFVSGSKVGDTCYIKPVKKVDEKTVSGIKGEGAKNTTAHIDEQIAAAKELYKQTVQELEEEVQEQIAERAKGLKPYAEPDATPLDKYEMAIFYMELCNSTSAFADKKISAIIKKIPVDKTLGKEEQLAEQWVKAPQEVINFLIREYITTASIEQLNTPEGIAFRKAVGKWKGVGLDKLEADRDANLLRAKQEYDKKLADLQAKKKELLQKSKPHSQPSTPKK